MVFMLLGLLVGIVLFGGLIAVVAKLSMGAASGAREGAVAPVVNPSAPLNVPPTWYWAWLHERDLGRKSFGYYYRDPQAGASFHIVAARTQLEPEALRACGYRGSTTVRLGAHESLNIPDGAPADLASFLQEQFETGGASGTTVLRLRADELVALGLPSAPPWIGAYLRG